MSDFIYNEQTGTFSLAGVDICKGYYGTETVMTDAMNIVPPMSNLWTITEAKNGTTVRIFSIPKSVYETLTIRYTPWKMDSERVWFMATFKSIEGHLRTWITKTKNFGKMFEEIVGDEAIASVMESTKTDFCISYFIRHKENDLYGEMKYEESHVIQTLVWNYRCQQFFVSACVAPPKPIVFPSLIGVNLSQSKITPSPIVIPLANGYPLLLTIFDGANIYSTKFITRHDELLRRFRCRTHNRFAALFATEQLVFHSPTNDELREELETAQKDLFTQDELDQFKATVAEGKAELFKQVHAKVNGAYVVFPNQMYRNANIKHVIENCKVYATVCERVWANLCKCTDMKTICAIEEFLRTYGRIVVN